MMKKMTLTTVLFFAVFTLTAQAQQSINAAGGDAKGSGGTVSFSVGQMDYLCLEGAGGTVSQGVQQFNEISNYLEDHFPVIKVEMVVYPNPATDLVNLKIDNYNSDNFTYALFDMQGRQLAANKIVQSETQIQLSNLASAVYLLSVHDNNKLVKTFKIIKQN